LTPVYVLIPLPGQTNPRGPGTCTVPGKVFVGFDCSSFDLKNGGVPLLSPRVVWAAAGGTILGNKTTIMTIRVHRRTMPASAPISMRYCEPHLAGGLEVCVAAAALEAALLAITFFVTKYPTQTIAMIPTASGA